MAKNLVFHGRSKHIDICYHFIRECIERAKIVINHVYSENQRADVLTKAMSTMKFERLRKLLGVTNLIKQVLRLRGKLLAFNLKTWVIYFYYLAVDLV